MVLGIAGGSCSGKSTLACRAAALIGADVLSLDKFYTRDEVNGPCITLSDGTTMFDFNQPSAIDALAVLKALGQSPKELQIVEGLFTLAIPDIRAKLYSSVYLELDADLRALRRMLRDIQGGRMSTDPEFIARYYIESARVGHARHVEPSKEYADAVFSGDEDGMSLACAFLVAAAESA